MSSPTMLRIPLIEDDLQVIRHALEAYVAVFGHDESAVRRQAQELLQRLAAAPH